MSESLVAVLREASEIVEKANVPEDLRASAFESTVQALLADAGSAPRLSKSDPNDRTVVGDALDQIATRLHVERSVAEQVFDAADGDVQLVVPASRLDRTKAKAAQQIALLISAGRQALALDESGWTSIEPVRAACEYFGRYDSGNFATTIRATEDVYSMTVRGSGKRGRELRMTAPAWDHARDLVLTLTGAVERR